MRRVFLLLVLFSFALPGCAQNKQSLLGPAKVTDSYSWDFGKRQEGELLKHTFVLKNNSKQTLNIKEINTSCGCTLSQVEKRTLLPAETTKIEVQFHTKGYTGIVQQYIYVHTDSADNPILKFTIKAEIIK